MTLAGRFAAAFGRAPAGRWSAPGRVNLIGEHVDYAGGLCLPLALAERTEVAAAPRDDGRIRLRSAAADGGFDGTLDEIGPGSPAGWAGYAAGVPWALRAAGYPVTGFDLFVGESVPLGAGLSSSAALECAVAVAVDALSGLGLAASETGRHVLASACRRAENDVVGAPTGGMDQLASLLGREGHALLVDMRDAGTRPVPLPLTHAGLALLVIDTGVRHRLTDGRYGQRRAAVERAAAQLGLPSLRDAVADDLHRLTPDLIPPARHVVTEIARVRAVAALLDDGRVTGIGPLLDASHASLAEDFVVSCPELDTAVAAARAAGALGARMTGGGFGGSAIALVPVDQAAAAADAVRLAFVTAGYPEPRVRPAVPSAGAG